MKTKRQVLVYLTEDEAAMLYYYFYSQLNSGELSESSRFGQLAAELRNRLEDYAD